jgi:hypothetical protein
MLIGSLNNLTTVNNADLVTMRIQEFLEILLLHKPESEKKCSFCSLKSYFYYRNSFLESEKDHGISATSVFGASLCA